MNTVAFFNNKGGVGKTTLVFHLAHMIALLGRRVLVVDLDPQSNLTAMCLSEERLEAIWPDAPDHPESILGSLRPILRGMGDIAPPHVESLSEGLALVPGDLALSTFEAKLSDAWPRALDLDESAYRTLSAFYRLTCQAAEKHQAEVVLFDVGPNLGAINRAALLASDFVVTPLAPDLFSMQGLRNLGPTLIDWRRSWSERLTRRPESDLELPSGRMEPLGYVLMQAVMRLSRPLRAYERWVRRMPSQYHDSLLRDSLKPASTDVDKACLGIMRHYRSLMPLAQDAQKPMFDLRPADGAIGAQMNAVQQCREDFESLALNILRLVDERSAVSA
jgi:chromosome partitioning protein